MKYKLLIFIGLLLILLFFLKPVPYCKLQLQSTFSINGIYTQEETSEIKKIDVMALNVLGNSMSPTILNGSQCLCMQKPYYSIGDVVFYFAQVNGKFSAILHRIVNIENENIYVKGDANNFIDPPLTQDSIVCAIPYVPRIRTFV